MDLVSAGVETPTPLQAAPAGSINIDSAPGGVGGSPGAPRRVGSEGQALGGVFLVARAAQLGPPEPVGSPAWLRNPARRARSSRFAQLQDWSSDAGPHLGI